MTYIPRDIYTDLLILLKYDYYVLKYNHNNKCIPYIY